MRKLILIGLIWVVSIVSVGCKDTATPTMSTSPITEPISPIIEPVSPIKTPEPEPEIPSEITLAPFTFDRPLREGDNRITGSGVPGIPIVIEDVTFAGKFIAAGQIDNNGRFDIKLSAPLEARHRIGLILNLADTSYTEVDFSHSGFRGEGAMVLPQIGFYHDTFMVLEP